MNLRKLVASLLPVVILLSLVAAAQAQSPALQERFEKKVREYMAADHAQPPPRGLWQHAPPRWPS